MEANKKGLFIVVDGPDGSGKTTNLQYLKMLFVNRGYVVTTTREPGGSELGEKLRSLVLGTQDIHPMTELLMFLAARNDHIRTKIIPAVVRGEVVLCDRYMISTHAYQGHGRGLDVDVVASLEALTHGNFMPDHTLFFDVNYLMADRRMTARTGNDRFDQESTLFKERVREGYRDAYRKNLCPNMHYIDANGDLESVQHQLNDWVDSTFGKTLAPVVS